VTCLAFTTLAPRYTVADVVAEPYTDLHSDPYSRVRESLVGTVRWRCRQQAASPSSHLPRAPATYDIFECRQRHPPLSTVFAALHCTPRCHWNICSGLALAPYLIAHTRFCHCPWLVRNAADSLACIPRTALTLGPSVFAALHCTPRCHWNICSGLALALYLIAHTRFCHCPWLVRNAADSLACVPRTALTLGSSLLSLCTLPGA